jgi:Ankyrin repeats (3 copies)
MYFAVDDRALGAAAFCVGGYDAKKRLKSTTPGQQYSVARHPDAEMRPEASAGAVSTRMNSLFALAIRAGVAEAVRLHLARGDSLVATNEQGLTPLMLAARHNRISVCRTLIDAGAGIDQLGPDGEDALAIARSHGSSGVIRHECGI